MASWSPDTHLTRALATVFSAARAQCLLTGQSAGPRWRCDESRLLWAGGWPDPIASLHQLLQHFLGGGPTLGPGILASSASSLGLSLLASPPLSLHIKEPRLSGLEASDQVVRAHA